MKRQPAYEYSVQDFTASLATDEYINRFRDADRFMQFCRQCPNYNNSWACPPFNRNLEKELRQFKNVLLIASKIIPVDKDIPISESRTLIRTERKRLASRLLDMERQYGGRAFSYAGSCLYCPLDSCTRQSALPCKHPELVRPSLEAYGFDIGRTTSELFGIDLLWGIDGKIPEYLTLVCGFFHNKESVSF